MLTRLKMLFYWMIKLNLKMMDKEKNTNKYFKKSNMISCFRKIKYSILMMFSFMIKFSSLENLHNRKTLYHQMHFNYFLNWMFFEEKTMNFNYSNDFLIKTNQWTFSMFLGKKQVLKLKTISLLKWSWDHSFWTIFSNIMK